MKKESPNTLSMPSIIDLYCGVGRLSLGAARTGFSIKGSIDNDLHAVQAHKENFPNIPHWQTDISDIPGKCLLEHFKIEARSIDGIVGAHPC